MTPREIAWRVGDAGRGVVDRWRIAAGLYPTLGTALDTVQAPPCRLTDINVGAWNPGVDPPMSLWRDALLRYADQLIEHRLTFFNLEGRYAGHPIDWNRDIESGRPAARTFAAGIDYRNAVLTGDAKVVWEPNRHQHLVALARAYRASGQVRYAQEAIAQMASWLDQSPFGYGMNWRSPLELAIRAINWVWTLDLIRESAACTGEIDQRIRRALHLHVWEIARKYSRGSSANNHLIGEAAGVCVATGYFPEMPGHRAWHEESRRILQRELFGQTHPDGGTREQATGYLVFVLQFYLAAGIMARRLGRDFPREYWDRIERMMEFLAGLMEGGPLPMLGDADEGYVLDLGLRGSEPATVLAAGGVVFDRADFADVSARGREWAYWLMGSPGTPARVSAGGTGMLKSRAFSDTGYYLLQAGSVGSADAVSLVFDCAELGFGPLAAHGHADALSFVLRVGGVDVLVDPGTYDYFTYPEWRKYLRGSAAHNTITIDGQDQSVITGPFMWGARAQVRLLEWKPSPEGGVVAGEHDGYARLADPAIHRRRIQLDATSRTIVIQDDVVASGRHSVDFTFQCSERSRVARVDGALQVEVQGRHVSLRFDSKLSAALVPPGDRPDAGWVSRGYHQRVPAPRIVAQATTSGPATFYTIIRY